MSFRRPIAFQQITRWNAPWARVVALLRPVLAGQDYYEPAGPASPIPEWCSNKRAFQQINHTWKMRFDEVGWRFFRRLFRGGRSQRFVYDSAGLRLDYAPVLLKAVTHELYVLASLKWMGRRIGHPGAAYLGTLLWPGMDRKLKIRGPVAALHGLNRWFAEIKLAILHGGLEGVRILRALFLPTKSAPDVDVIWFGATPNEYGKFGRERSFYWAAKVGDRVRPLYVLARAPSAAFKKVLREDGVQWVSRIDVLRWVKKSRLPGLAWRLFRAALPIFIPLEGSLRLRARLVALHLESLVWTEVGRSLPARAAMGSTTSWTWISSPFIALQAIGYKTALWAYSANCVPFGHSIEGRPCFNGKLRSVSEAQRVYVWSEHVAEWTRDNLYGHPRNEIVPVGPVMCGDASKALRPRASDDRLRLAVFDVTSAGGQKRARIGATHLSWEYYEAFWRDMRRLVADVPELVLVLKPKRGANDPSRTFPDSFHDLYADAALQLQGRLILIDSNADPYEAVAACDVALSMPFTSPALAAWHFGRVGLFYDPIRLLAYHRFDEFGRFFPRSYDKLLGIVREILTEHRRGRCPEFPGNLERYTGPAGGNPQTRLLNDLRAWSRGETAPKRAEAELSEPEAVLR
ncbi:MAG: hypothetical protein JO317_06645 [Verrucomicrobiae bacterium]|nr:hypothetical protein [Verrucomicrobiae bacterium]